MTNKETNHTATPQEPGVTAMNEPRVTALEDAHAECIATIDDLAARKARLEHAINRILADPYGCVFCDSGALRNPDKWHAPDCGFMLAMSLTGAEALRASPASAPSDKAVEAAMTKEQHMAAHGQAQSMLEAWEAEKFSVSPLTRAKIKHDAVELMKAITDALHAEHGSCIDADNEQCGTIWATIAVQMASTAAYAIDRGTPAPANVSSDAELREILRREFRLAGANDDWTARVFDESSPGGQLVSAAREMMTAALAAMRSLQEWGRG